MVGLLERRCVVKEQQMYISHQDPTAIKVLRWQGCMAQWRKTAWNAHCGWKHRHFNYTGCISDSVHVSGTNVGVPVAAVTASARCPLDYQPSDSKTCSPWCHQLRSSELCNIPASLTNATFYFYWMRAWMKFSWDGYQQWQKHLTMLTQKTRLGRLEEIRRGSFL